MRDKPDIRLKKEWLFSIRRSRCFNPSVVAIGAILSIWGGINLLEGYGGDNPGAKSQGAKQFVAGAGVALIGTTLIPLLTGLFGG